MFVAWRDLRFAKGRFALMGTVIAADHPAGRPAVRPDGGPGPGNTSAITGLARRPPGVRGARRRQEAGLHRFRHRPRRIQAGLGARAGRAAAEPLGTVDQTRARRRPQRGVAVFGVEPGSTPGAGRSRRRRRWCCPPKAAAALAVRAGDRIDLGGQQVTVAACPAPTILSHTPVVWTADHDDPQRTGNSRAPPTLLALSTPHDRRRRSRRSRPATGTRTLTPGDVAVRDRLVHRRERLAPADARLPVRHLRAGHRRVLHRVDHPAQRRRRRPEGAGRLDRLPAQGRPRPGRRPARRAAPPSAPPSPRASGARSAGGTAVPFVLDPPTVLVPALS